MKNLKEKLEYHYKKFNEAEIELDPVQFPHKFSSYNDIETMAFISSIFAYGNVKQIDATLNKFLLICENKPYDFLLDYNKKFVINFKHRFYSSSDIHNLFIILKFILKRFGSIKELFLSGYSEKDSNVKQALINFSKNILKFYSHNSIEINRSTLYMFPNPEKGSACKRMNLFLRWMVRKDNIDFGLWSEIPKNKLVIPTDTHIAKISKQLKLTKRKNVSWRMAEEITENLKKFDSEDPIKYDFSLCHIGMRKRKF